MAETEKAPPVLIVSTLGATNRYPDQAMLRLTLGGFLNSLERQTSRNFRCFLACHNVPPWAPNYSWLQWYSMAVDPAHELTDFWVELPKNAIDPGRREIAPYGAWITDMSRKTFHAHVCAGRWACEWGVKEFWLLRIDSDDLLAKDAVETIERLDREGFEAVFSRRAHMFDPKGRDIARITYPYSLTCNAIKVTIEGNEIKRWFYLCSDHTLFASHVAKDNIPFSEQRYMLCIVTNSGNSISNRPPIDQERSGLALRCTVTPYLVDRYGLDFFLERQK